MRTASEGWHIGVIGGSGLSEGVGLENAQDIAVNSPFGAPSGPVTQGTLAGIKFSFLARHGTGHVLPPGAINYRANIDVLKRCGVTDVVSLSAIGSLREDLAPGHFVAVDQFIDRTTARVGSFFGPGLVAHVSLANPVCPRLAGLLADAVVATGGTVHRAGCYIAIDGPQFSTRAESRLYRAWGADVIGMTAMPEARLAREAQLPYGVLAMVTDYDCWRDSGAAVEAAEVFRVMAANAAQARAAVRALAASLPPTRAGSPIDTALAGALATAPSASDPRLTAMLDAILAKPIHE